MRDRERCCCVEPTKVLGLSAGCKTLLLGFSYLVRAGCLLIPILVFFYKPTKVNVTAMIICFTATEQDNDGRVSWQC